MAIDSKDRYVYQLSFQDISLTAQKFDVIMGQHGDGSLNKVISEPPFSTVEAKDSTKEIV